MVGTERRVSLIAALFRTGCSVLVGAGVVVVIEETELTQEAHGVEGDVQGGHETRARIQHQTVLTLDLYSDIGGRDLESGSSSCRRPGFPKPENASRQRRASSIAASGPIGSGAAGKYSRKSSARSARASSNLLPKKAKKSDSCVASGEIDNVLSLVRCGDTERSILYHIYIENATK